jgi:ribosomal protein L17
MKKSKPGNRGNRESKNLLTSLVLYERVETTISRGKDLKMNMEKLLSGAKAKKSPELVKYLKNHLYAGAVKKMTDECKSYEKIKMVKLRPRVGDGSLMCQVSLLKSSKT